MKQREPFYPESGTMLDSVLQDPNINIFDIFGALYRQCKPNFPAIYDAIRKPQTLDALMAQADKLSRQLPSIPSAMSPIDSATRDLVAAAVADGAIHSDVNVRCYGALRAIDGKYDNVEPRAMGFSSLPVPLQLNLNGEHARVYPKYSSPFPQPKERARGGKDAGIRLRDRLSNLVCLVPPPGLDIDLQVLDSVTRLQLPQQPTAWKVALVPLLDEMSAIQISFHDLDSDGKIPFRFASLTDPDAVTDLATAILARLSDQGVTLVVFPELCLPEAVRHAIAEGLSSGLFPNVKMVIGRSLHEEVQGRSYNVAHVLGPDGKTLWRQQKLSPYTAMWYEVGKPRQDAAGDRRNLVEDITCVPQLVSIRDTPLGRTVVLICQDFILSEGYVEALLELGANLVVVPAMSAVLQPDFPQAADRFARFAQAVTLVSNACFPVRDRAAGSNDGVQRMSFVWVPARKPVRWHTCDAPVGRCVARGCCDRFIWAAGDWTTGFGQGAS